MIPSGTARFSAGRRTQFLRPHRRSSDGTPELWISDPTELRALVGTGAYLACVALLALALGVLLRHVEAGIAAVVVLLLVIPAVLGSLPVRAGRTCRTICRAAWSASA